MDDLQVSPHCDVAELSRQAGELIVVQEPVMWLGGEWGGNHMLMSRIFFSLFFLAHCFSVCKLPRYIGGV